MNVPFMRTLRAWVAAAIIAVATFVFYYICIFPDVYDFYSGKLYVNPKSIGNLRVRAEVPLYVASFGQRWVYFTVENHFSEPLHEVTVWLDVQRPDEIIEKWNLPSLYGSSYQKEQYMVFEQIPLSSTVYGRLPLYVAGPISGPLTVTLWVTATNLPGPVSLPVSGEPKIQPPRYLAHSFLEQILLPPWSNRLIVLAVFIICALVDNKVQRMNGLYAFWHLFYVSSFLILLLLGGVLILPSIAWIKGGSLLYSIYFLAVFVCHIFGIMDLPLPAFLRKIQDKIGNWPLYKRLIRWEAEIVGRLQCRGKGGPSLLLQLILLVGWIFGWVGKKAIDPALLRPLAGIFGAGFALVLIDFVASCWLVEPSNSAGGKNGEQ